MRRPRLSGLEGVDLHRRIYLSVYVFVASFTFLNVLGSLYGGAPYLLLWAYSWLSSVTGLTLGPELAVLTHWGVSVGVLAILAYTLYRVRLSSSIMLLTVVYIYTTAGTQTVRGGLPLYMYLLNVSMLMMVMPYARSVRLGVSIGETRIFYRLFSIIEDYFFPVIIASGFAVVILTIVEGLHGYVTGYMPEPYRSVFGPMFSTRLGLLAFTLVVFLVFMWTVRELLDLPVLYVSTRRVDALVECRNAVLEEAERLNSEPKAVVHATSTVTGLLISYTLWFLVYDWVVDALALSKAPDPILWLLATLTMILASILVNSAVKKSLVIGLREPGRPRGRRIVLALMLTAAYIAVLAILFHVDVEELILIASGVKRGGLEDPVYQLARQLDSFFGVNFNDRVRRLEDLVGLLMRILWR